MLPFEEKNDPHHIGIITELIHSFHVQGYNFPELSEPWLGPSCQFGDKIFLLNITITNIWKLYLLHYYLLNVCSVSPALFLMHFWYLHLLLEPNILLTHFWHGLAG